jgi:hypothetical protein
VQDGIGDLLVVVVAFSAQQHTVHSSRGADKPASGIHGPFDAQWVTTVAVSAKKAGQLVDIVFPELCGPGVFSVQACVARNA